MVTVLPKAVLIWRSTPYCSKIGVSDWWSLTMDCFFGAICFKYSLISEYMDFWFTYIPVNESLKISLKMDEDLFISLCTFIGISDPLIFLQSCIQWPYKFCRSLSSSATFLSLATVLTITPKPFGLILWTSLFNLLFSSLLSIFCEIEILLEKGTRTRKRPAKDSSELILGPFVEIGSFMICTSTDWLGLMTLEILPSLSISDSKWNLSREKFFILPALTPLMNLINDKIFGPKSW